MTINVTLPAADPIDQDVLTDLISSPKRVRTDEGVIEERPLKEVIEANNSVLSGEAVAAGPFYGMRMARTRPPGTV